MKVSPKSRDSESETCFPDESSGFWQENKHIDAEARVGKDPNPLVQMGIVVSWQSQVENSLQPRLKEHVWRYGAGFLNVTQTK